MNTTPNNVAFMRELAAWRRRWQTVRAIMFALRLGRWILLVLVLYSLLDTVAAFSQPTLVALDLVLLAGIFVGLVAAALGVARMNDRAMAVRADRLDGNRRRSVLAACELANEPCGDSGIGAFLVDSVVTRARAILGRLHARTVLERDTVRNDIRLTAVVVLVFAAYLIGPFDGAAVTLRRICMPWRDAPPFTRFEFLVIPAAPQVVYGGDIGVAVRIDGPPVTEPVMLMTRYAGQVRTAACFQQDARRFAQRMEKVTSPVEFCFRTGRARSEWRRVELRLQPRVIAAQLTIAPPRYSGLPARTAPAGMEGVAGLKGSRVELRLTSNRPLAEGTLTVTPSDGGSKRTVVGRVTGRHQVAFDWTLEREARIEATIRDIQRTANPEPFVLPQTMTPDAPPAVTLDQPGRFALATPGAALKIEALIEDDLGLQQASLVRSVVGFRDRASPIAVERGARRQELAARDNLGVLGVQAGDVLEYYVEARDGNPDLTGVGYSPVARVQVIAEKDYAEILRMRTTADDIAARYKLIHREWAATAKALDTTRRMLLHPVTAQQFADSRRELLETLTRTSGLLRSLGNDFPLFAIESAWQKELRSAADAMQGCLQALTNPGISAAEMAAAVADLEKALAPSKAAMAAQAAALDKLVKAARTLRAANAFQRIARRQEDLVRRLNRFEAERTGLDRTPLAASAGNQRNIREDMVVRLKELRAAISDLSDYTEFMQLGMSAAAFADAVEELQIEADMQSSATAAEGLDAVRHLRYAKLALEKLKRLLKPCEGDEDDPFRRMCNGQIGLSLEDMLRETLEQLLRGMGGGVGDEPGFGIGGGGAGDAEDGYSAEDNQTFLNTPVYGPSRIEIGDAGAEGAGPGAGGAGQGRGSGAGRVVREAHAGKAERPVAKARSAWDSVPEKYRAAAKKYFSGEE